MLAAGDKPYKLGMSQAEARTGAGASPIVIGVP